MKRICTMFVGVCFVIACFSWPACTKQVLANEQNNAIYFDLCENNKHIKFNSYEICTNKQELNRWGRNAGHKEISKTAQKIKSMGFSSYTTLQFLFPGMNEIFDALEEKINIPAKEKELILNKNGKFEIISQKNGKKILREETAKQILNSLQFSNHLKINIVVETLKPKENNNNFGNFTHKKSHFSTWCGNSSQERKNNIALALDAINGTKIEKGEKFSFNKATGTRNEFAGYKKAKIIQNGEFVEGFGGGVCQVSTTLYNALLLAGLDILEVHQHSLPVSYIPASQDAMVSGNSADLVFKNNTCGPIFIKANFLNNETIKIEIFGEKNEYNYQIDSKITKILPSENGKNGCESEAYLIKKDFDGKIISQIKIRENTYAPSNNFN